MATEVYEDSLELDIETLEAIAPDPDSPAFRSAHPLPYLRKTGQTQRLILRTLVIENSFLQVMVVPGLGGRVLRILDKRTNQQILGASGTLSLRESGPRGVESLDGIRWSSTEARLNDLGPVDLQVVEAHEEGDAAGIWMAELVPGQPLSTHIGLSLPPDKAEILVEVRTYNRGLRPLECDPHLTFEMEETPLVFAGTFGSAVYDRTKKQGLLTRQNPDLPPIAKANGKAFEIGSSVRLGPRQTNTLSFSIVPLSGLGGITAVGDGVAIFLSEKQVSAVSAEKRSAKIVLRTADGQTLEAPAELAPEQPLTLDLSGISSNPVGIGILDEERRELLRWEAGKTQSLEGETPLPRPELPVEQLFAGAVQKLFEGESAVRELHVSALELGLRAASFTALGIESLRRKAYADADGFFDEALLFNGEDHLTWWLKAACLRLRGNTEGEKNELLNAHYLAPLEPTLRAESFFECPDNAKVLEPLKEDPSAMIEVACQLYDCGLYEDLSRWTHSCLALRGVAMLRYLLAAALLESASMDVEAASELRLAAALPIEPPYPWRDTEKRVLAKLLKAFPGDGRLQQLALVSGE